MFKLQSFKIINSETKERFLLDKFDHTNLSEKELAEVILLLRTHNKEIKDKLSEMELVFNNKMKEKQAHKYQDLEVTAEIKEKSKYEYDFDILKELKPLITEEQYKNMYTVTYTVNKRVLNSLIALGGTVKDIIDRATKKKEYKPTIKIEKIS